MRKPQTFKPFVEGTGIDRLYKRVGVKKVSFFYQYPDGRRETLETAQRGDRIATGQAEKIARQKAVDIQAGQIVAGSTAELIDRFETQTDRIHFRDQSKDGTDVRKGAYNNLRKFFGIMAPHSLRRLHGYQYLEARAAGGAPAKANKELSLMSTICHYAVRWGIIEANPFTDIMQNKTEKDVRTISRSQIVRFYLWSLHQTHAFRNAGCAAMFTYLTGFRAAEVRPFHIDGLSDDGVRVISAKRKKGKSEVSKLREWSVRLRTVVVRAKQTHKSDRKYLFANQTGQPYTRSGWGSVWQDAMFEWISTFDKDAAAALGAKKAWDAKRRKDKSMGKFESDFVLVDSEAYFSLLDIRPAAITTKIRQRAEDAYDFAAHANPSTTHRHYDRRTEKKATATE
jgi:integrase